MESQAEIIKFIQSFSSPILDVFFILVTNLGSGAFYYLVIPVFYWSIDKKAGILLTSSLVCSMYINVVLKEVVALPRPIGYPGIRNLYVKSAGGFSFPSGHAQGTSTFWGIIMKWYHRPRVYRLGIAVILVVGLSRLYLGVHWPIDVLAGTILGLTVSWLLPLWPKALRPIPLFLNALLSIIIPVIPVFLFPHRDNFIYMGTLSGSWLGYILEEHFIGFEPENKGRLKSTVKYIIGIIGFFLIYLGLKSVLPPHNIYHMLRYFIIGLWLTSGAPILFRRFDL